MKIKTRFLLWAIVAHLMMATICLLAFRDNLLWLVCSEFSVFVSAVVSAWFWHSLAEADRVSATCIEMLNEQDFSAQLRQTGNRDSDRMIDLYNRMITEMRKQRLNIRGKNEFLDLLVEASDMGVITFDFDMRVAAANPAALKFLKMPSSELLGRWLGSLDNALAKFLSALVENAPQVAETDGVNRYRCSLLSFVDSGFRNPFILIEELTHELLSAEKNASEKVIRTMSHEVNNTLSAINSNLSVLLSFEDCFPDDLRPDIVRALQMSIQRSDNLCGLVSTFADIVKLPPPVMSTVSLHDIVQNTVSLMQGKFADAGVGCALQLCSISPIISADSVQMEQALINILKNAMEACKDIDRNGAKDCITVITTDFPASLTVRDAGCGVSEELRNKIFTPFFTTKPGGQGIGLMLVCEILLNHRFKFDLRSKDGFTDFRIEF